jgi:glutaredoxin
MKKVVLYSMNKCPHCETAKAYLDKHAIAYRLCNIQTPAGQKEFSKLGLRGVPVLKIGDQILKGFSVNAFKKHYKT